MSHDMIEDNALDVPNKELVSQDEIGDGRSEGNALLKAMGGGAGSEEFFDDDTSIKASSKVTPRAVIIAVIAVLGGGMIYAMREYEIKQGMIMDVNPTMIFDTTAQVKPLSRAQEHVLSNLRASVMPAIPAPNLQQNPMELEQQNVPTVVDNSVPTVHAGPDIESLTNDFMAIFDKLQVSSIVPSGNVRVAVVNRKAVTIGATIEDIFVVRDIAIDPVSRKSYVMVELVGFDPAVDGAELILHIRSKG
jgi:hypothetical protein